MGSHPGAHADFGRDRLGENLALVFVAFNTFFGLAEQSLQVDCFANVASALAPGGRFVMEAFVPDLGHFDRGHELTRPRSWCSR